MAAANPERRFKNPVIFVCDIQDKFRPLIHEFDKVVLTARKLVLSAIHFRVPIFVTTQNRARLGPTVPDLQVLLDQAGPLVQADLDKTLFSMWLPEMRRHALFSSSSSSCSSSSAAATVAPNNPTNGHHHDVNAAAAQHQPPPAEVALLGIESHICIAQTALDLLGAGHRVYVLADGVSSSNREEVGLALARLRHAGAVVTTSESWLYELVGDAAAAEFKGLVGLVKQTAADTSAALQGLVGSRI